MEVVFLAILSLCLERPVRLSLNVWGTPFLFCFSMSLAIYAIDSRMPSAPMMAFLMSPTSFFMTLVSPAIVLTMDPRAFKLISFAIKDNYLFSIYEITGS